MAVKKHAKTDTKLFFSCPVLLDYSILFQIFCPGLWFSKLVLETLSFLKNSTFLENWTELRQNYTLWRFCEDFSALTES